MAKKKRNDGHLIGKTVDDVIIPDEQFYHDVPIVEVDGEEFPSAPLREQGRGLSGAEARRPRVRVNAVKTHIPLANGSSRVAYAGEIIVDPCSALLELAAADAGRRTFTILKD